MKFNLVEPSNTLNIVLTRDEISELLEKGRISADKEACRGLYDTVYEDGPGFIQFVVFHVEKEE